MHANTGLPGANSKCESITTMTSDFALFIPVCRDVISPLLTGSRMRFTFGMCERYNLSLVFKSSESKV